MDSYEKLNKDSYNLQKKSSTCKEKNVFLENRTKTSIDKNKIL